MCKRIAAYFDYIVVYCTVYSPSCDVENKVTRSHDLSSGEEEELLEVSEDCHENHWDCESILSTYSNLYNHPVAISDPVSGYSFIILYYNPKCLFVYVETN